MIANSRLAADKAAGDSFRVVRTVPDLPSGRSLTKAWLTIKTDTDDPDPGLLQKTITTTATSDGQITDDGSSDTTGGLYFVISAANSAALGVGRTYRYDIQVKLDDGSIGTVELGTFGPLLAGVTAATS